MTWTNPELYRWRQVKSWKKKFPLFPELTGKLLKEEFLYCAVLCVKMSGVHLKAAFSRIWTENVILDIGLFMREAAGSRFFFWTKEVQHIHPDGNTYMKGIFKNVRRTA